MIKFYKNTEGMFVLGPGEHSYVYPGQFYSIDNGDYLAIYNAQTGIKEYDSPYFEYEDGDGVPYQSMEDLISSIYQVFLPPSSSDQFGYTIYTDTNTDLKIRTGLRDGGYVIDKELVIGGFDGIENTG